METFSKYTHTLLFLMLFLSMTGCDAIGTIFQAGAWYGAILVILGVGLVIWLLSKLFGGSPS